MIRVQIDKRLINPTYFPLLKENARFQLIYGGSASGKSKFGAQRIVLDLLGGQRNYLIVRNVGRTIRTSMFNEIKKVISAWKLGDLFKINESEMTFTCINRKQAISKGLDDVEKMKSVTPIDGPITDILVEEATEIDPDDFKQLEKRLRGWTTVKKRITLLFNPVYRTHWIFKRFFCGLDEKKKQHRFDDTFILRTTYKDNNFLSSDDIEALEKESNEYYYNVYTLGLWGVLGALVFTNWHVEDLTGLKDAFPEYCAGLDFGFTNDPTCYTRVAPKLNKKQLYITHGFYESGLTNDKIAERIQLLPYGNEPVRCDPSEPKSIAELRNLGINAVKAYGGKGSVNYGIQFLQQFEIIIDKFLQDHVNEFSTYQWEKDNHGNTLNVPVDYNNHAIDSTRYSTSGIRHNARKIDKGKFNPALLGLK